MRYTEISYTRGATINTGNYSSQRLELSATVQVDEDENVNDAFASLKIWVEHELKIEVKKIPQMR